MEVSCLRHSNHLLDLQESVGGLVSNDMYWDTILLCSDGNLVHNKLTIALIFPHLASSNIFSLPVQTTVLLPDHTVKEVQALVSNVFGSSFNSTPVSLDPVIRHLEDDLDLSRSSFPLTMGEEVDTSSRMGRKLFKCGFCSLHFEKLDVLVRHKKLHSSMKPRPAHGSGPSEEQIMTCVEAAEAVPTNEDKKESEKLPVENGTLAFSDLCLSTLAFSESPFKPTIQVDEKDQPEIQPLRAKIFYESDEDVNGMNVFENDIKLEPLEKKPFEKLNQTRRKKEDEKTYSCSFCAKTFPSQGPMLIHERTHTKEYPYSCNYCHRKFNQSWHVKVHERIHTGERPFMCSDCGKCFASNSTLTSHKVLHQQDRPYKCKFCEKGFNHLSGLRSHENLHTGEEQFMCSECGKTYNTKKNLNRHHCKKDENVQNRITNPDEKHMCLECGKQYKTKKILRRHKCTRTFELPSQSAGIRPDIGLQLGTL